MKNIILKTISWIAAITFIVSACLVDSESNVFYLICGISGAWLWLFILANRKVLKKYER